MVKRSCYFVSWSDMSAITLCFSLIDRFRFVVSVRANYMTRSIVMWTKIKKQVREPTTDPTVPVTSYELWLWLGLGIASRNWYGGRLLVFVGFLGQPVGVALSELCRTESVSLYQFNAASIVWNYTLSLITTPCFTVQMTFDQRSKALRLLSAKGDQGQCGNDQDHFAHAKGKFC